MRLCCRWCCLVYASYRRKTLSTLVHPKAKTAAAPYPQVRATCLVNTNTHEMIDAQIGSMDQGELTLASQLKAPVRSITLFDRAYFSADFFSKLAISGRRESLVDASKGQPAL